jgi:phosphate-selective porin OprO/OprP
MRYVYLFLLGWIITVAASAQSSPLEAYWDDGLKFQSRDSSFKLSAGGRVHYDIAFSRQSRGLDTAFKNAGSKVEVRRARLSFEGTINNAYAYEFEFTFREQLEYADMYFAFLRLPFLERLTVGYFREPFGLEEMTSSNSIVFMERSLTSVFGPSRNTGLMVQKQFLDKKLRGYAGLFRRTDDLGADLEGKGNHSFTTRWVYNPPTGTDDQVVHLGLSFNRYTPDDSTQKVETVNEVNTNPEYLTTSDINGVRTVNQFGGELGYANGPLCLQGEWIESYAALYPDAAPQKSVYRFNGFHVIASMFLKGGRRTYSSNGNRFASIKIDRDPETGKLKGAWEAALRLSHIDLSEAGQFVNKATNLTAGLNWYVNSTSRVMANYVHSFFNGGLRTNTLQFRMQVSF